ncbi:hypothetical protein ACIRYZ_20895 [Kitasatospora sp. NPDC101155]|uniref:hypothetical protein n=1 Tax=Kitasatospora sp. NPDC101155 TaxID=3364097 RepID=UPI00380539D2
MRYFRSRVVRAGIRLLLVVSGAAFGLAQDNWPRYTGAAMVALGVVFVLHVVSELEGTGAPGTADAADTTAPAVVAATPTGAAHGGVPERDEPTDGQDLELCDFCGRAESRTEARWGTDLPEGWLALEIDRRSAEVLYRTYCSEEHMRLDLAGPLPAPEPFRGEPWDEVPRTARHRLTDLAWALGLLLLSGFLLLGCGLALRFLIGLL